jgi:hypothetical protein
MIKFFRKIRQKMLTENKFSKYLIYAIGEIILVVIGILIALQVNNWNEGKKIEQEQLLFLNTLKKDLNNDLEQLDQILAFQQEKLDTINALKDEMLSTNNFNEIERLFAKNQTTSNSTYFPNTGSYTTAVSSGKIANLNPSDLKVAITNLYERYYYRLIYNGEVYDKRNDEVAFRRGKFFNKITLKLNSADVIEDSEFANLITILIYDNTTYVNLGSQTRNEILRVLDLIDQRLKN